MGAKLYKTIDGGQTWTELKTNINTQIKSLYFNDNEVGWAISYYNLLKTIDGGGKWSFLQSQNTNYLECVHSPNNQVAWTVGYYGTILKTKTSNTHVEKNDFISKPTIYLLSQNYPNPFNTITTITYTLSEPSIVTLEIFDLLGRKVATLVNDYQIAGNHKINFNATDGLPSSLYIYRLNAGKFSQSRKLLFLK